uniref:Cathepsin B-like n=1 Tax=Diabrotica virgifera virgifera TaxID=50390 RepID=A0A6P7GWT2_DIAVI
MKAAFIITLLLPVVLSYTANLNPLSNEFINYINSKQSSWVAGRNFDENISIQEMKKLLGTKKRNLGDVKGFIHSENIQVPDSFDARENWKVCSDVINTIADQSACSSGWAVAAASAMSDRRCIASQGKFKVPVSAENVLACIGDGCDGGYMEDGWWLWLVDGIPTGGLYGSNQGCQPYSLQTCEHNTTGTKVQCSTLKLDTPTCRTQCNDPALNYKSELTFASGPSDSFTTVANMQKEILTNGPVETTFRLYSDFWSYKSGVYQHVAGDDLGYHSVRVLGWGVENGVPYWLAANSWNEDWGDKGLFKILRGKNEVDFEYQMIASRPKV